MIAKISAGAACDRGLVRDTNEDRCFFRTFTYTGELGAEKGLIAAVADGMGGHSAGEAASERAVQVFASKFSRISEAKMSRQMSPDWPGIIREAFQEANLEVIEEASRWAGRAGMGTTLTAIIIVDGVMYIGHVGDSRAYLIRNGKILRLTQDHTWVEKCVREGKMTPEEAANSNRRGQLINAIGLKPTIQPDIDVIGLRPEDRIIICTDGITEMLSDHDIKAVGSFAGDVQKAAASLVSAANQAGGYDNSGAVVIHCHGESSMRGFRLPTLHTKPPSWAVMVLAGLVTLLLIDGILIGLKYIYSRPPRPVQMPTHSAPGHDPKSSLGDPFSGNDSQDTQILDMEGRPVEAHH